MELLGKSQSTFSDMVSELGLAGAMRAEAEYTLLAPFNAAFTGESHNVHYIICLCFPLGRWFILIQLHSGIRENIFLFPFAC